MNEFQRIAEHEQDMLVEAMAFPVPPGGGVSGPPSDRAGTA
jgi:hypothetical protein